MTNRNPGTRVSRKLLHVFRASQDQCQDQASSTETLNETTVIKDQCESDRRTSTSALQLITGGVAGATSRTVTAPLDRIKVMLQVSGTQTTGMTSCVASMIKEGGVRCLWRGNLMNVIKVTPESALKFTVHEKIMQALKKPGVEEPSDKDKCLAGMSAGAISQSAIYPLDVLKTRLAIRQTGQYRGIWDCACTIFRTEGFRSFYKGAGINIVGAAIYAGIEMPIYGKLRDAYRKGYFFVDKSETVHVPIRVIISIATVASMCGQLVAYPFALVRTKLQAQRLDVQKHTVWSLFRYILQSQGVAGLYRGLVPNMLKAIPAISITYLLVEKLNKKMGTEKSF